MAKLEAEHVAKLKAELKRLKAQQRQDRRERYKRFQQLRDTLKAASTSPSGEGRAQEAPPPGPAAAV